MVADQNAVRPNARIAVNTFEAQDDGLALKTRGDQHRVLVGVLLVSADGESLRYALARHADVGPGGWVRAVHPKILGWRECELPHSVKAEHRIRNPFRRRWDRNQNRPGPDVIGDRHANE